ncbi:uncharacterized protein LOC134710744 [Mytilus trossulus]|uniref:uncharacterized protein LOC134710744 n=1 Tax=Mytilus trossulus TaxID=6551 RepID=UPI0030065A3A
MNGFLKSPFSRDVVISTETTGKLLDFTSVSQLTYSGQKQHELEISFNAEGSIRAWRTNFDGAYNKKKVSGKFSFSAPKGIQERIEATGHIETPISEPVSISLMFNNNNEQGNTYRFQTQAEITYSGTKQHAVLANFHHAGPLKAFTTSADVTYNTKKSAVQVSFDSNVNIEGKATLKTPFMDDIVLSFGHNGHPLNFKTQARLTYSGAQQHAVLVNFKHTGVLKAFTTSADITYNTKTASVQVSLDSKLNIEGKAIVKTPFTEDIVLSIGHSGQHLNFKTQAALTYSGRKQHAVLANFHQSGLLKAFTTSADVTYNTKTLSVQVSFESNLNIEGKAIVKTPFTEDIVLSIGHSGQPLNFKTQAALTYSGWKQHDISATFSHDGSLKKFSTSSNIVYNTKRVTGSVLFDSTNGVQSTVSLNTPLTKPLRASFSHNGQLVDFNNQFDVTYGGSRMYEVITDFKFEGELKKFQSSGSLTYNRKTISSDVNLDILNDPEGTVTLRTSFTDDITVSFSHQGTLHNFISHGEIGYNGRKQHEANIVLQNGKKRIFVELSYNTKITSVEATLEKSTGRKGRIEIKSPYTKDIELEVDHRGELLNFNTKGEITINGKKEHEVYAAFEHNGDMTNFRTSGAASYNTKRVSSELQFDSTDGIKTKGILNTPFTYDIEIIIDHKGSASNFRSQADISYSGSKQHEAVITVSGSGTLLKFQLSGDAMYNGKRVITSAETDFTRGIKFEGRMSTPFTENMEIFLYYQGTLSYLRSQKIAVATNLKINKETVYGVDLKMSIYHNAFSLFGNAVNKRKMITLSMEITPFSLNINLQTPILGYERTHIKASIPRGQNHALVNIQSSYISEIDFDARLTGHLDDLKGSLKLKTGFKNLQNIRMSIQNEKSRKESKFHIEAFFTEHNGITIDTSLTQTDWSVSISTPWESLRTAYWHVKYDIQYPYYEVATSMKINEEALYDVDLNVNIVGDTFSLSGHSAVRRNKISLVMEITQLFSFIINLVTPIRGYEKTHIQAYVSRKHYHAELNIQTSYLSEIDFDARLTGRLLDLDGYLRLKTGFDHLRNIRMSIKNENNHEESNCHIQAFFTERNGMTIHLSRTNMDWSVSVSTPWKSFQTAYGKIKFTGRYPNWIVTTNVKINEETIYDVDFEIDIHQDNYSLFGKAANDHKKFILFMKKTPLTLNINLKTPIRGYEYTQIEASISRRYDHAAMNINIQTSYLSEIDFDARLTGHRFDDLDGSLTLKTGFDHLQNIRLSIKHKGNLGELITHIEAFYIERHRITIDASLTKTSLSVSLSTPLKSLRTAYGHVKYDIQSTYFEVATHLKINEETLHDVSLETSFVGDIFSLNGNAANRWKKLTLDIKITPLSLNINLQTPIRGYERTHIKSSIPRGHYHAALNIQTSYLSEIDFDARLAGNFEMDAKKRKEITLIFNVNEPKQMTFELKKLLSSETYMLLKWNKQGRDSSCRMDIKFNSDWSDRKQIVSYRGACGSKSYSIGASYHRPDESSKMVLFIEKDDIRTHGIETIFEKNGQAKYTLQLPSRTVVLSTVSSEYGISSQVFDFSWDAERDQNKRVVIKTRSDGDELTLGLEMPSLRKDVQLDYKMLIGSGNVIYDGRTAFRYSKDSRKTFTLSSKLEDVSGRGKNYKFLLGISHPYTTVDIQTKTEIGKSNDKLSADFDIQYLTARRQIKNIAIITDIGKLKRHLNIQVRSPIKTMKLDARVETSPFKLTIKNLLDDTKPINSQLIVDHDDGSLNFYMNYDIKNPDKTLHVNAKFSDEKGISAELFRNVNQKKTEDSSLNLQLKTSKILHTSAHWRPSIISDLKAELTKRIEEYGIRSAMAVEESSDEINKEIVYKRRLFQAAYTEEIKSYDDAINDKLSELRTLKADNAFYFQDICNSVDTTMNRIGEFTEDLNEAWSRSPFKHTIDEYMTSLEQLQQRLDAYSKETYINMGGQLNSISTNSYRRLLGKYYPLNASDHLNKFRTTYKQTKK